MEVEYEFVSNGVLKENIVVLHCLSTDQIKSYKTSEAYEELEISFESVIIAITFIIRDENYATSDCNNSHYFLTAPVKSVVKKFSSTIFSDFRKLLGCTSGPTEGEKAA